MAGAIQMSVKVTRFYHAPRRKAAEARQRRATMMGEPRTRKTIHFTSIPHQTPTQLVGVLIAFGGRSEILI